MSDQPKIQIDDDWKRQAQEEKRRLAEAARRSGASGLVTPALGSGPDAPVPPAGSPDAARRELSPASFAAIVQTFMTQTLFYLGELAVRGGEQMIDLDMAKHQLDLLSVLEEKTRGNLSVDEQRLLDSVLYELRSRFVAVASQYVM